MYLIFFCSLGVLLEHVCRTISLFFTNEKTKQRVYYACLSVVVGTAVLR